jgi:hypothetical protein
MGGLDLINNTGGGEMWGITSLLPMFSYAYEKHTKMVIGTSLYPFGCYRNA